MKKLILIVCTLPLLFPTLSSGQEAETNTANYLVIVSIDGFRPDFYLDETWPAPMLQQMSREGAHAIGMKGVFPSVTYPSHTTMVTGSYPANHGILFNSRFGGGSYYFEYDSIKTETIWDAANEHGFVTANVGWPVTLYAPFDFNIPISGALQNSGIDDDPIRTFTSPDGFFEELEREAVGRIQPGYLSNSNPAKENRVAEMASYIVVNHQPNLLTVALQHTDSMQHRYGREHPRVRRAVAAADRALTRIVEAYEEAGILDETVFMIGGDHGFTNISMTLAPNVWLSRSGINADTNSENWDASFATAGGSAFLYLNDPDDQETLQTVIDVVENLPQSTRKHFTFIDRDELDDLQSNPHAKFALSGSPSTGFSGSIDGDAIRKPGSPATHGHLSNFDEMNIGFVAWGAGVREGTVLTQMDLVDFAPIAAHFLGLSLPESDGAKIPGIFEFE